MATQPLSPGTSPIWPVRVAVLGGSVTLQTEGRTSRAEGTYAEVLGRELRARGLHAEVTNRGAWYELLPSGTKRWWTDVRPLGADVLVVHYGMGDSQPAVVPHRLARALFHPARGDGWRDEAWRSRVMPVLWPLVRRWQVWAGNGFGRRTYRVSPARFRAELHRLIAIARHDHSAVLVLDRPEPNAKLVHFQPGLDERWATHRRIEQEVVAGFETPEVRFLPLDDVVNKLGHDETVPDGLHFSPKAHALVAQKLADHVEELVALWAAQVAAA